MAGVRGEGRKWYVPHFGAYHPRKPDQIRVVFDSSAEFQGVSLNKELLPGPDLMNSLVGVLIRFRQDNIAVMCDIEQMFHTFHVDPKHQNFLRFLWFKDNDPSKRIIENKMTVDLFGNGPSPAIATFGLRKTADDGEEKYGKETRDFVHRNFYVDDGLTSCPTENESYYPHQKRPSHVSDREFTPTQSSLQLGPRHGSLPSRRSRQEHQRSRPTPRCTTIATLSWGPLEHREGPFHLLCLPARKALHTERSSVCNKNNNNNVYFLYCAV